MGPDARSVPSESSYPRADPAHAAAAALVGLLLLTAAWALLHVGFWADNQIVDTPLYERYGEAMAAGEVPYRDFEVEYPPAALPVFALPALAPGDDFRAAFEVVMWACAVALLVLVVATLAALGAGPRRLVAAATLVALAPLALGSVVLTRYDLWPAALVAGAVALLVTRRDAPGLAVLGLAVAAKLYPLVLLGPALIWTARRRGPRAAAVALGAFLAVVAAVVLPFALIAPEGIAGSVERQLGRPLQIESLGASLLLAAHQLGFHEAEVVWSHGSQNLAGTAADAVAAAQVVAQALAVAAVWALLWLSRPIRPQAFLAACAAAVCALVAFGKVLSPQFLLWLVPLVPLVAGRLGTAAAGLLVAALVTTQLWFPYRYWDVVALSPAGWLVLARNALLVALAVVLALAIRTAAGRPRSS